MKSNEHKPSGNNPAKPDASVPIVATAPLKSVPKTDLRPDLAPIHGTAPRIVTLTPAATADTKQPAPPSVGKGRDAELPSIAAVNRDGNGNRWQQPT